MTISKTKSNTSPKKSSSEDNQKNDNPLGLKKLTPIANPTEHQNYVNGLLFGLQENDTYNIGLTGTYGSGKSSILESLKAKINDENLDFVVSTVSLASFTENENKNDLEIRIVQQILYQENIKGIRYSRFKRIEKPKKWKILLFSIALFTCLASTIIMFNNGYFSEEIIWLNFKKFWFQKRIIIPVLFTISSIGLIYYLSYSLYVQLKLQGIKGLNIKEGGIQLGNTQELSTLNLYLDEILHYFEESKTNVLIIEDLDRFKDPRETFTKLREINQLINRQKGNPKKVTFIYSVKDDLFPDSNKNMTKFFDLIVPVIPFVNYSNSGDMISKSFSNTEDVEIDWKLYHEISLYIDDMRILNNVYNEFIIYKKTISSNLSEKLNDSKLFSILLIKNVAQKFFLDLQSNSNNFLELAFDLKRDTIEQLIGYYNEEIQGLKEENEQRNQDISEEINKLEEKRYKARFLSLKEIISSSEYYEDFSVHLKTITEKSKIILPQALQNELIFYLIANGYLGESYQDYISLFHENGRLNSNDRKYVRMVVGRKTSDINFKISHPTRVIKWLDKGVFLQEHFVNLDIIKCLIERRQTFSTQYQNFLDQLYRNPSLAYEFFRPLLEEIDFEHVPLINDFLRIHPNKGVGIVLDCSDADTTYSSIISKIILQFGPANLINQDNLYEQAILNTPEAFFEPYIEGHKKNTNNYINALVDLHLKFNDVSDLSLSIHPILLESNAYELTSENLQVLIFNKLKSEDYYSRKEGFFTHAKIRISPGENTYNYFLDNLDKLIPDYRNYSKQHLENEEVIVDILSRLTEENDRNYFAKAQIKRFESISSIENEDIRLLVVKYGLFAVNWDNLKTCIDNKYNINDHISEDFPDQLGSIISEEISSETLLLEILGNDLMWDESLRTLTKNHEFLHILDPDIIDHYAFSRNLISGLVENNVFEYNPTSINWISQFGLDISTRYVLSHLEEFAKSIAEINNFTNIYLEQILEADDIGQETKEVIFNRYLDTREKDDTVIQPFVNYALENFTSEDEVFRAWNFFTDTITSNEIDVKSRATIFCLLISHKGNDINDLGLLLEIFSPDTKKLVWTLGKKTTYVKKGPFIKTVLSILQNKGYISSFREKNYKLSEDKYVVYYKKRVS